MSQCDRTGRRCAAGNIGCDEPECGFGAMPHHLAPGAVAAMADEVLALRVALTELVARCDGPEGVRADGSNIQTIGAHAALGHFADCGCGPVHRWDCSRGART